MPRDNDRRVPLIERKIIRPFNFIVWGTAILFLAFSCSLPSFLNAPIRAKVAVAEAEMRNLSAPLEGYFVDYDTFPPGIPFFGDLTSRVELTTPVVYISKIPESPVWTGYFAHANRLRILLLSTLPVFALLCAFWYAAFRRMPASSLVYWWEAVAFWLIGGLVLSSSHEPNSNLFAGVFYVSGCFSSLLWIGHYFGRRNHTAYTPPGRAFLLCAILPLLFCLRIALNQGVNHYAEASAQNSKQTVSYLYATDAKSFWILLCTGPDNVYDTRLEECPMESNDAAAAWLIQTDASGRPNFLEYDPTNGTLSTGDLMRSSLGVP